MKDKILAKFGAIGVLGLLVPAFAQADSPKVFPRDSVIFGRTYGEYAAAWWQWAYSIPVSTHPLFDNGGCSVGQSGPVWFLGGKFCSTNNPNCSPGTANRSCTVPAGKALFFPIVNGSDSVLEEADGSQNFPCTLELPNPTINCLRQVIASGLDDTYNLAVEIDGKSISPSISNDIKSDFREQSVTFDFTLPSDNVLNAIGEGPFTAGTYYPMVDDGVYVMLAPLSKGNHTLHFTGKFGSGFTIDITYNLVQQ